MVLQGEKRFTLLPPACAPFLHEELLPAATYVRCGGRLEAVLDQDGGPVPWIPFDILDFDPKVYEDFANYGQSLALEVTVKVGTVD